MDDMAEYCSDVRDQYLSSVTVTDIQIFSRQNWKLWFSHRVNKVCLLLAAIISICMETLPRSLDSYIVKSEISSELN